MPRKRDRNKQLGIFGNPLKDAEVRFDGAYWDVHDKIRDKGGGGRSDWAYNEQVQDITAKSRKQVNRGDFDELRAWGDGYEESVDYLDFLNDASEKSVREAADVGFWRFPRREDEEEHQ